MISYEIYGDFVRFLNWNEYRQNFIGWFGVKKMAILVMWKIIRMTVVDDTDNNIDCDDWNSISYLESNIEVNICREF